MHAFAEVCSNSSPSSNIRTSRSNTTSNRQRSNNRIRSECTSTCCAGPWPGALGFRGLLGRECEVFQFVGAHCVVFEVTDLGGVCA